MNELVSIITPTFNSSKYIFETILSVQKQTYQNWEMIIVDDCSRDNTVEIINNFISNDNRIQLHQLELNSGSGVARNKALSFVKGDFVAFLDADDLWFPNKLTEQLEFMSQNKLHFTFSYYELINEKGEALNIKVTSPKEIDYSQLFYCNWIGNLTGIYDSRFFGIIPISSFRKRQDWILWLEIVKKIKVAIPTPKVLAYYRRREDSISASKLNLLKSNFSVYRKYHKQSFLRSSYNMILFLWNHFKVKSKYRIKI
jgi:teichuronic acid biosynthesis glycosyltransferase TuaG